ncbi:MAG: hypothetical protein ABFD69_04800 [Candidatus Sumerlaeia bacterium]
MNARHIIFLVLYILLQIQSFGAATAGSTTPGTTAYPNAGMQLVRESDLRSTSGTHLFGPLDGYVYYLTGGSPGIVKKIRFADMAIEKELMLNPGETRFPSGVIDPTSGTLYLAAYTDPAIIVRVRLADLTRLSSMTLSGEKNISCSLFDPSDRHIYFGLGSTSGKIVKIRSSDFTRVQTMPLEAGESPLCAVLDESAGFAYFGVGAFPGKVVKIRLSDFTRVGTLTLPHNTSRFECAAIDPAGGYAYFAMDTIMGSALIARVRLSDFSYAGFIQVYYGYHFIAALIDPSNGYGYFATRSTYQGYVIRVRLADFTIAGKFVSPDDNRTLYPSWLDRENGYMYGIMGNFNTFTTQTLAKVAYTHKNTLHASKVTLTQPATVKDMRFYAHAGGGHVRLAIYDDSSPRQLLWQSIPSDVETSNTWVVTPPKHNNMLAKLSPGTYWLAWQTDSTSDVASYAEGSEWNAGFTVAQPYGDFPATLNPADNEYNSDLWSLCLTINQTAAREWFLYR